MSEVALSVPINLYLSPINSPSFPFFAIPLKQVHIANKIEDFPAPFLPTNFVTLLSNSMDNTSYPPKFLIIRFLIFISYRFYGFKFFLIICSQEDSFYLWFS